MDAVYVNFTIGGILTCWVCYIAILYGYVAKRIDSVTYSSAKIASFEGGIASIKVLELASFKAVVDVFVFFSASAEGVEFAVLKYKVDCFFVLYAGFST